jgi:HK97 gp10 family phage protein
MTIQEEVNEAIRKLQKVSDRVKADSNTALRAGAKPIVSTAKSLAPRSKEEHYRYKDGRKVATYYPGNLRRSIRVLPLRKTKSAVIIGPKLARSSGGPAEGQFSGNRVDGYYAHFVEFGSLTIPPKPYMRPAATQAGPAGLRIAVTELKKAIDKYANSIAI